MSGNEREALAAALWYGSPEYKDAHPDYRVSWENNYVRDQWFALADAALAAGFRRAVSPAPSGAEAALAEAWRRGWADRDDHDPSGCTFTVEEAGCPNPYGDPWCRGCNPSGNSPYPPCERHSEPDDCEVPGCGPTSACSIGCENAYLTLAPSAGPDEVGYQPCSAECNGCPDCDPGLTAGRDTTDGGDR